MALLDIIRGIQEKRGFAQDINSLQQFLLQQQQSKDATQKLAMSLSLPPDQRQGLPGITFPAAPQFPQAQSAQGAQLLGNTLLQQQQQQAALGLQAARPVTPESESQFTAFLGRKIAAGTASPQEETLFEQLTKVPEGTQIFTGAIGPSTKAKLEQDIIGLDDTIATLEDIGSSFETEFQTFFGKGRAGLAAKLEKFNVPPAKTEAAISRVADFFGFDVKADPTFLSRLTTFQTTAYERLNAAIKEITGVAVRPEERPRIAKQTVDPDKDSPTQFISKRNEAMRIAQQMKKRRLLVLARGQLPTKANLSKISLFEVDRLFEREVGSQQIAPETQGPKPIQQMNEAELDKEIKELEAKLNASPAQNVPAIPTQPIPPIGPIRPDSFRIPQPTPLLPQSSPGATLGFGGLRF